MRIHQNKGAIAAALILVVLLLLKLPFFITRARLPELALAGKWLESALFLAILVLATFRKNQRTGKLWLILGGISLAGTLLNLLLKEAATKVLPNTAIATGMPDMSINLFILVMMSMILCWRILKEKEGRFQILRPIELLICLILLGIADAFLILIGIYYGHFYANIFSGGSTFDLFSIMTSSMMELINQISLAAFLISEAVCIWGLAYGVFGVPRVNSEDLKL